jgi:hypothetical protein
MRKLIKKDDNEKGAGSRNVKNRKVLQRERSEISREGHREIIAREVSKDCLK